MSLTNYIKSFLSIKNKNSLYIKSTLIIGSLLLCCLVGTTNAEVKCDTTLKGALCSPLDLKPIEKPEEKGNLLQNIQQCVTDACKKIEGIPVDPVEVPMPEEEEELGVHLNMALGLASANIHPEMELGEYRNLIKELENFAHEAQKDIPKQAKLIRSTIIKPLQALIEAAEKLKNCNLGLEADFILGTKIPGMYQACDERIGFLKLLWQSNLILKSLKSKEKPSSVGRSI